ncbi:MAG: hypothetical protein F4X61_12020 [Rhodothermaceae bacterium]|nr:hypothetical protein [Rhodothermaceae bacterium]
MPDRHPHDEIEVLKGQVAALTHCVSFLLTVIDRSGDGAALYWLNRRSVVASNDLRREGINQVLDDIRQVLERNAPDQESDDA